MKFICLINTVYLTSDAAPGNCLIYGVWYATMKPKWIFLSYMMGFEMHIYVHKWITLEFNGI